MDVLSSIIGSLVEILILTLFAIIPIFIIWFFMNLSKKNSKMKKYRNFSITLMSLGCFFLLITGTTYFENFHSKSSSNVSTVADGFTIEEYKIKLNVNKNNVVDVTEIVTVDFYESGHHGIYKFIPSWLEYTGKDGNTISRKSTIQNLKAEGEEYSIDTVNGKDKITIGSPSDTLTNELKTYTITYQYDMGEDPFDGFDEFIFHSFGDYWGTRINNASLEITMPDTIEESSITFFSDKYRKNDITSYVDYYVVGNTLYAKVSSSYDLKNSLTVDIELPEGYFIDAKSSYGYSSLISCLLIILFAIVTLIKWLRHGKDYHKRSKTVQFYPPEGYDSATIGYIYKKDSGRKLAISIILELASKGFIKIDELKEENIVKITNLCPMDINKAINRQITITKLKEAKNAEDEKLMNSLFEGNSSSGVITENFNEFYDSTKHLVSNGYIQIDSDSISNYTKEVLDNMKNQIREKAFLGKPQMTSNEQIVYDQLFADGDTNILSKDKNFYQVFDKITKNLQSELDDKINDTDSYKNMAITSVMFLVGVFYLNLSLSIFEDLNPKFNMIYIFAFISLIVILILTILMKRKNTYGEQMIAEVNGFRNFLETATEEQINHLVSSNPNYFYDILPYAYILGVSKAWVGKFGNISVPKIDIGNFDYVNIDSFTILSNSIYYPSSSSSSSGCSSCGGGCSSCGGGGSW